MSRYVVDTSVVLHLLTEDIDVSSEHQLVAPSSIRSQVLAALYGSVRSGDLTESEGLARHATFSTMKLRLLGDKVMRRRAWEIADRLGWESTYQAEFIALTQLQADAFVTLDTDLAQEVSGLVRIASIDDLIGR